jgi:hypothetical protein
MGSGSASTRRADASHATILAAQKVRRALKEDGDTRRIEDCRAK